MNLPQRNEDTKKVKDYKVLSQREEILATAIVDSAFIVHKNLGPGLLEKIYESCFAMNLAKRV